MNTLGFALGMTLSWLVGACSVVAAILGFLALRRDIDRRRLWWAWGWWLAPWLLGFLFAGYELVLGVVELGFSDGSWDLVIPIWLALLVAVGLVVAAIARADRENPNRGTGGDPGSPRVL